MNLKKAMLIYGVVFLLALPLTFPVKLLAGLVTLPEGVAISPLKGSLWSARLDWLRLGPLRLNELSARPSLTGLFAGVPIKLSVASPLAVTAKVGSHQDGATIRDLKASVRLERVRELLNIPPLGFDSAIALVVEETVIQGEACQTLDGELRLSDFEGNIEGLSQLKEITGSLTCETGRVVLNVNPDNALRLSGKAIFFANGHYQVTMLAEPPPGPLFETFVDLLGQPRDGRRFQLNFRS